MRYELTDTQSGHCDYYNTLEEADKERMRWYRNSVASDYISYDSFCMTTTIEEIKNKV